MLQSHLELYPDDNQGVRRILYNVTLFKGPIFRRRHYKSISKFKSLCKTPSMNTCIASLYKNVVERRIHF